MGFGVWGFGLRLQGLVRALDLGLRNHFVDVEYVGFVPRIF